MLEDVRIGRTRNSNERVLMSKFLGQMKDSTALKIGLAIGALALLTTGAAVARNRGAIK